jgi:hypothetical protein
MLPHKTLDKRESSAAADNKLAIAIRSFAEADIIIPTDVHAVTTLMDPKAAEGKGIPMRKTTKGAVSCLLGSTIIQQQIDCLLASQEHLVKE